MKNLNSLLNIFPTNESKIEAINNGSFSHADMHEFLELCLKNETPFTTDTSKKSLLDVINVAILQNNKTIKSMTNEIFPMLLKNSRWTLRSLIHLSNNFRLSASQQMLLFSKVIKDHQNSKASFDFIDPINLELILKKCIEISASQKSIDETIKSLSTFENMFFFNYEKEFTKAILEIPLFEDHFKNIPTKSLLAKYKSERLEYVTVSNRDLDNYSIASKYLKACLRKELSSRGHVIKKSQSNLIRKMSIHAGEKLSLKEAQHLSNQLKKRKKK